VRQGRGWTLQELADAVSLSVSTIHRYETGQRPLKVGHLENIAAKLKCPPGDLLRESAQGDIPEEQELLALFRLLSHDQRRQAIGMFNVWLAPSPLPRRARRRRSTALAV